MEEWREIPGFLSRYGRYYASKSGLVKNGSGLIMLLRPNHKGYKMVRMIQNSRPRNIMLHRAVALAWIPNPENKPQINHINSIKTDNRIENLEWCTASENITHSFRMGTHKPRKGIPCFYIRKGKLTDQQVLEIRAVDIPKNGRGAGAMRNELCQKYGVSIHVIKDVRAKRSYYHVP